MSTCHFQHNQGITMGYLKDFQTQVSHHDYPGFLRLWEEYCHADEVDPVELVQILKSVKGTSIAEPFGRHVEKILPLWKKNPDSPATREALKLIFDIQTTNHEELRHLAFEYLQTHYSDQKHFNDKIRLIGLRGKESFQGALSAYELLSHMERGNYVFHTGGWGVGEILDVSLIREQLSLEFDYVPGRKDLSFANAFKTLIPIPKDHFLALRFGDPDLLEKKARENSAEVIRMLLRDLGPKTAAEIKDELCDLVIPAAEWTRWWQGARAKVKKDTFITVPEDLRDPFILRNSEITHEDRFQKALEAKPDAHTLIQMVYSFIKDFSETLKNSEFKDSIQAKLRDLLKECELSHAQELQVHFCLQDLQGEKNHSAAAELIKRLTSIEEVIEGIEIIAFKKRALVEVRKARADWQPIFLNLLFVIDQAPIRDYLLAELLRATDTQAELKKKLEELVSHPQLYPDAFLWYFQKMMNSSIPANAPFADQRGKSRLFEGLLILLNHVEQKPEHKDLVKKIYTILSGGRFAIVREIMQKAKIDEVKEFLLLSTKCHSLNDHDIKILHSLAEVAHPNLAKGKKKTETAPAEAQIIWTTAEGYQKLQTRIQQIATVETVENAKEIEVARSHGDLRENAEFKAALEKRDRLQSELKLLSDQLNKARIFTQEDVSTEEVGVGTLVSAQNQAGENTTYTLLGPWDANPEKNILSFQSKLAQAMKGLTIGDKFKFQGEEFTITAIRSYFDKK